MKMTMSEQHYLSEQHLPDSSPGIICDDHLQSWDTGFAGMIATLVCRRLS